MSILSVVLTGQRWDDSKDGSRTYLRTYDVYTDSPAETMVAVRAALPLSWEADPVDGAAVVVTRSAEQDPELRTLWHGEVNWTWEPTDPDDEQDPLDLEPKIRWTSFTVMVPRIKDRNGKAMVNKAGDYFDPPLEDEVGRWTATIQFNATAIPTNLRQYRDAVNQNACTIDGEPVAAERSKIRALDISEVQYWSDGETVTAYRSITLSVEVRDDDDEGFDLTALNQGYRELNASGEQVDIFMPLPDDAPDGAQPERVSSPVMLDDDGKRIANPTPDNIVFCEFETSNLRDLTIFPGIEPVA